MMRRFALSAAALGVISAPAVAQTIPAMGHTEALAIVRFAPAARLAVTSPAFADGGPIPLDNTQYGADRFPGLAWNRVETAKSYVIIIQGAPDRPGAPTSIHLTVIDIPPAVATLGDTLPAGAAYGPNVHGSDQPYAGPHTHTTERQAYHFQVFALDTAVPAVPGISFEAIEDAMTGHVIAGGDLVAYAAKPADR